MVAGCNPLRRWTQASSQVKAIQCRWQTMLWDCCCHEQAAAAPLAFLLCLKKGWCLIMHQAHFHA